MRPAMAVVIWIVLIGGMRLYMGARQTVSEASVVFAPQEARGVFAVEVTPTFAIEPDPFALQTDGGEAPASLVLRVNGREIVRLTERVEGGRAVRVDPAPGLVEGLNEFFLAASPPLEQSGRAHAVRVLVTRDGSPFAERTFWFEPGTRIAATFVVQIEKAGEPSEADEHGH